MRPVNRARSLYGDESLGVRIHVGARVLTCPLQRVVDAVPRDGQILDFGCGHGLLSLMLADGSAQREVTGFDVDEAKISIARRVGARALATVDFTDDPTVVGGRQWDGIVICDVLYLLDLDARRRVIAQMVSSLAPGGVLVIKEIDVEPAWKLHLAILQEHLATRVLRITEGSGVEFLPPAELRSDLEAHGLHTRGQTIDRYSPYPHQLTCAAWDEYLLPAHEPSAPSDPGQPDAEYFDVMDRHAREHWWYRGRRAIVADALGPRLTSGAAIDIGCGTGDSVDLLAELGASPSVGTDLSGYVLGLASARKQRPLLAARAEELPFGDGVAPVLTSMEVLEHLDGDVAALQEYRRVLQPGGTLLVTVPAYQWLWSDHDVRAAHRRRYNRGSICRVVEQAGFDVERATYYDSFLLPAAALVRRTPLGRLYSATDEEVSSIPVIDSLFSGLAELERWILRAIPLPFGLSILVIAHPAGEEPTVGQRGGSE